VPGAIDHLLVMFARGRRVALSRESALALLLAALTLAVYGRAVGFGFVVFDDPRYVTDNFQVLSGLSLSGIRWACATFHDCNWIPLTWISLMLDATLYGRRAGGFHATNILLHVANVLLVFALFAGATRQTLPSAFVAALFAIHPMHVESVAWVTERKDVLSMFFGLLSLCAYVRYARSGRIAWLASAFLFFVCSLASKPTFVTLPFVFLLFDFWPLGRIGALATVAGDARGPGPRFQRRYPVLEKLPFFIVSAALCGIALWAQTQGGAARPLTEVSLPVRALNAILAYGLYLEKAVAPLGLAIFYPHPVNAVRLAEVVGIFAILAAITGYAIANARSRRFLIVGWLWYLGTLVPMIGLVQVGLQQRADRYAYFPYLGLYVAIVWLVAERLSPGVARRRPIGLAASGVIALYSVAAFIQVGYWRDGITLMRHDLEVVEECSFARSVLADALMAESRVDEALEQYQRAVELAPHEPLPHVELGMIFYDRREFRRANEQFRAALEGDNRCGTAHAGLAVVLCAQQRFDEGRAEFLKALEVDKKTFSACAGLAVLCRSLGEIDESIAYTDRALEIDDSTPYCQRLRAMKLVDQGLVDDATECLRQLAATAPWQKGVAADLQQLEAMKVDRETPVRE
jgi:tetratricopeptide (TPR) repeat protein